MGNIAHLRNQFKSINTFAQNLESYHDYIKTLILEKNTPAIPFPKDVLCQV